MSLVSCIGALLGLVPAIVFLGTIKGVESYRLRVLIVGCSLVLLSTLMLGLMTDFASIFDVLQQKGSLTEGQLNKEKADLGLWLIMFPAIVGAIGANLITSWFQSKRPNK